jgi:hypothetical protein
VLTFEDAPPADRARPWDPLALGLATCGCVAAFFGSAELLTHRFVEPLTLVPLLVGLLLIGALLVAEYRGHCALLEVPPLVSTFPTTGIVVAICAAAASVSAVVLSGSILAPLYSPSHLGLLYLPEFAGAVITAFVFGVVFRSRALHYFVLSGLVFLTAGILVIGHAIPPSETSTLVGTGLIGVGVGSAVTPALFLAGYSLRSSNIQRVFAIIELLRAVAAFMIAPVLLHFALTVGHDVDAGTRSALWICFGLAVAGALVGVSLYWLGGVRHPPTPDLERWQGGDAPAWYTPPLLAAVRGKAGAAPAPAPAASADGHPGGRPELDGGTEGAAERAPAGRRRG